MDWLAMIWGWALFGIRHRLSLTNDSKEATVWFFESIVFFFGLWRPSPFKGFVQQRRLTADLGSSGFGFGESEHHHFGHLVLEGHAEVFFLSGDVSSGDAICGRFIYKLGEIGWSEAPVWWLLGAFQVAPLPGKYGIPLKGSPLVI